MTSELINEVSEDNAKTSSQKVAAKSNDNDKNIKYRLHLGEEFNDIKHKYKDDKYIVIN